jgi:hypothetical protein
MNVLFILGAYQKDRPERWASKHKVFSNLERSLSLLGIESYYYCNKKSVKPKLIIDKNKYFFDEEIEFQNVLSKNNISVVFIWGGRTDSDVYIKKQIPENIKIIYGESGWFPQSGTCYFSPFGTNASANLLEEGFSSFTHDIQRFQRLRKKLLNSWLGRWTSKPKLDRDEAVSFLKGSIFVPLQDEKDTNILLSSPFKKMADFIGFLSHKYPEQHFIVRPHPRASYDTLPKFNNVTYQDREDDPYKLYNSYAGVIGLNSTMLMQFSLMGLPVVGLGEGVAKGCNGYIELSEDKLPDKLSDLSFPIKNIVRFYDYLLSYKQLEVSKLDSLTYLESTYIPELLGIRDENKL